MSELQPAVRRSLYNRKSPGPSALSRSSGGDRPQSRSSVSEGHQQGQVLSRSSPGMVPMTPLTPAQPRRSWRWLDATSCVIDDPASVSWLCAAGVPGGGGGDARREAAGGGSRGARSKIDGALR